MPCVNVRSPDELPVNVPVPTINSSELSSKPMIAFASLPLSITKPESPDAEPDLPVPNSIN